MRGFVEDIGSVTHFYITRKGANGRSIDMVYWEAVWC